MLFETCFGFMQVPSAMYGFAAQQVEKKVVWIIGTEVRLIKYGLAHAALPLNTDTVFDLQSKQTVSRLENLYLGDITSGTNVTRIGKTPLRGLEHNQIRIGNVRLFERAAYQKQASP